MQQNIGVFYVANRFSCHAEKDAIMKVRDKNILSMCKIYIVKIVDGKVCDAHPCEMCKKLLSKYNVEKYYQII